MAADCAAGLLFVRGAGIINFPFDNGRGVVGFPVVNGDVDLFGGGGITGAGGPFDAGGAFDIGGVGGFSMY